MIKQSSKPACHFLKKCSSVKEIPIWRLLNSSRRGISWNVQSVIYFGGWLRVFLPIICCSLRFISSQARKEIVVSFFPTMRTLFRKEAWLSMLQWVKTSWRLTKSPDLLQRLTSYMFPVCARWQWEAGWMKWTVKSWILVYRLSCRTHLNFDHVYIKMFFFFFLFCDVGF